MLDAPEAGRASRNPVPRRVAGAPALRRDLAEDFDTPDPDDSDEVFRSRRTSGLRLRFRGGLPRSTAGRAIAATALVAALGAVVGSLFGVRHYLLRNDRFVIQSSASVQISGNSHLTRPQLLSVFGEDVDRNLLTVSLTERRAELERLPWVEHATVMRLLPNKLRVAIVERKPVAFVRQGSNIGLVDSHGVLLDMASDDPGSETRPAEHYSFPVVTGLAAADPDSTRLARMKLYQTFTSELDSSGTKLSDKLSEVDVSNPEDVKALIPEGSSDILVHFGDANFLDRYRKFEQNLPKWRTDYPKLASADMRYERQVVLEMQPGAAVPVASATPANSPDAAKPPAPKPAAKTKAVAAVKHPAKPVVAAHPATPAGHPANPAAHLQKAFAVPADKQRPDPKHSTDAGKAKQAGPQ